MIKQCSRVALIASSIVLAAAVPAHAAELPDEPVTVQLKGEPELALAWGGDGAVIASEGDLWSFRPVEALVEVGEVLIVHEDGGQCLSPSESGPPEQAPLELVDCADAVAWAAVFDDVASNQDWRFTDPEGRFLGLAPGVDPADGAPVVAEAVLGTSSVHDQEWLFEAAPEETPPPEETSPRRLQRSPSRSFRRPAPGSPPAPPARWPRSVRERACSCGSDAAACAPTGDTPLPKCREILVRPGSRWHTSIRDLPAHY
ncbi:hypothetical protein GCM10029992_61680 [Glycomyces albus]